LTARSLLLSSYPAASNSKSPNFSVVGLMTRALRLCSFYIGKDIVSLGHSRAYRSTKAQGFLNGPSIVPIPFL
jgi:hypothetical protein